MCPSKGTDFSPCSHPAFKGNQCRLMPLHLILFSFLAAFSILADPTAANLYDRLEAPHNSDADKLEERYLQALVKYERPRDRKRIQEAYEVLSDAGQREVYDFYQIYSLHVEELLGITPNFKVWDPFEILGLENTASEDEIVRHYVELSGRRLFTTQDRRVHEAFAILVNPQTLSTYETGVGLSDRPEGWSLDAWRGIQFDDLSEIAKGSPFYYLLHTSEQMHLEESYYTAETLGVDAYSAGEYRRVLKKLRNELNRRTALAAEERRMNSQRVSQLLRTSRNPTDLENAFELKVGKVARLIKQGSARMDVLYSEREGSEEKTQFLVEASYFDTFKSSEWITSEWEKLFPEIKKRMQTARKYSQNSMLPGEYLISATLYLVMIELQKKGSVEFAEKLLTRAQEAETTIAGNDPPKGLPYLRRLANEAKKSFSPAKRCADKLAQARTSVPKTNKSETE